MSDRPPLPYPRLQAIPRDERPSVEAFRVRWERPRLPVVLTGVTDGWAARAWTPESLAARFGTQEIAAYVLRDGRIQLDRHQGFLIERMPLARYVEASRGGGEVRWYLRAALGSLPAALSGEVPVPPYAGALARRQNLWFAMKGTVTHLHFDLPFNLVANLFGRKRFVLFAPAERPRLAPHPWLSSTPHLARVDAEHPNFLANPRLRDAEAWEAVLEPGDVLFLPPRWWHYARALDTCLSVNTWWSSLATFPVLTASDAYKRLRGLNI